MATDVFGALLTQFTPESWSNLVDSKASGNERKRAETNGNQPMFIDNFGLRMGGREPLIISQPVTPLRRVGG